MLDNYYQNQRRYVRSVDQYQLLGMRNKPDQDLASECEPFRYYKKSPNLKLKYTPCGVIANSIFNG